MFKDWLYKKVEITDIKLPDDIPDDFISKITNDEELWLFVSPPNTWKCLCGRAGYCIVKDGEIIDYIVTILN